VADP